jgi:hypothetical protein
VNGKVLKCNECNCQELIDLAVARSVDEFKLLFPNKKVTANIIKEWCAIIESDWIIRRILKQNLKAKGHGQWSYYE